MYKKDGKVSFAISKPAKRFPHGNCIGAFGGLCNGRIIAGYERNVYEYHLKNDEWKQIQKDRYVKHDRKFVKSCVIRDKLLVVGPSLKNRAELIQFKPNDAKHDYQQLSKSEYLSITNTIATRNTIKRLRLLEQPQMCASDNVLYPQTIFPAELLVKPNSCTLTNIGNNVVMLIESNPPSMFIGNLENTMSAKDILWLKVPPLIVPRYDYLISKMQTSVYVMGGFNSLDKPLSSCVYYDLVLNSWFTSKHSLPHPLCNSSVVVSKDETFAVITGGQKQTEDLLTEEICSKEIIIFTEEDGFRVLKNSTLITERSSHISILIS